jgi:hypothetical protein
MKIKSARRQVTQDTVYLPYTVILCQEKRILCYSHGELLYRFSVITWSPLLQKLEFKIPRPKEACWDIAELKWFLKHYCTISIIRPDPIIFLTFSIFIINVINLSFLVYFVMTLKVHKIENFFGFDFEICTFS